MVGARRTQITLLRRSTGRTSAGMATHTYTPVGTAWAEIATRTTREIDIPGQAVQEETNYVLTFRYYSLVLELKGEDLLEWGGRRYEPMGIAMDPDGRRRQLTLPVRLMHPSTVNG